MALANLNKTGGVDENALQNKEREVDEARQRPHDHQHNKASGQRPIPLGVSEELGELTEISVFGVVTFGKTNCILSENLCTEMFRTVKTLST